jgi:GNAT superfamily N-acetyltransferase
MAYKLSRHCAEGSGNQRATGQDLCDHFNCGGNPTMNNIDARICDGATGCYRADSLKQALKDLFPKEQIAKALIGYYCYGYGVKSEDIVPHVQDSWDFKELTLSVFVALPTVKSDDNIFHYPAVSGYLSELLGCPSTVQSWGVEVPAPYRGRGLGKLLLRWKMDACRSAGKTSMIATVANYNAAEQHILEGAGWRRVGDASADAGLWMVGL